MKLEKELIETLRILDSYFQKKNIKYVLIGAQVPNILICFENSQVSRPTKDIDLALKCDDWEDYTELINDLIKLEFYKKSNEPEHRLFFKRTMIDLIPYVEKYIKDGYLTFPESKNIINVQGFDKLFQNAVKETIDGDLQISVIPLHLSVYSKIIAFLDRGEQQNNFDDIIDIVYIFKNYEDIVFSERRFDIDSKYNIEFEYSGAFLVGQDLKKCLSSEEIDQIWKFLSHFTDEYSYPIQRVSSYDTKENKENFNLFSAFKKGFEL